MNVIDVLHTLKQASGVSYRVLWESKGPKNTSIAEHGSACLFTPMGQPCGLVYVQVFAKGHGWEIFLSPGIASKDETFQWVKRQTLPVPIAA